MFMVILIVPGKNDQISGRLQNFKIKICCQGVLVTLVPNKHLHLAREPFRQRFRECCSGHKLGQSPRNRAGKPELHHHLQLEALASTSIQICLDRFPEHSSLRSRTWMISACFIQVLLLHSHHSGTNKCTEHPVWSFWGNFSRSVTSCLP